MDKTSQYLMNNTTQQFIANIPFDDWPLAVGIGVTFGVIGIVTIGVISYWWFHAPGPLPDTTIIELGNTPHNSVFIDIFIVFLNLNLAAQVFCVYLYFFSLIINSYTNK